MRVGLLVVLLLASGCGGPGDGEIRRHAEAGAEQVRPLARALAAEFDSSPETVADEIVKCLGRPYDDPAEELNLLLRVEFDDADQAHLEKDLVPAYEQDGWRHRTNVWENHIFVKDELVLIVSRQSDSATITASAGCWPD